MLQERLRAPAGGLFSIKQQAGGLLGRKQGRSKSCSGPRVFIKRGKKKTNLLGMTEGFKGFVTINTELS